MSAKVPFMELEHIIAWIKEKESLIPADDYFVEPRIHLTSKGVRVSAWCNHTGKETFECGLGDTIDEAVQSLKDQIYAAPAQLRLEAEALLRRAEKMEGKR